MSVIELQRDLEFFPDQRLTELAQQGGNERYPGWLVDTVMIQRREFRERQRLAEGRDKGDANPDDITTQLVAELQGGIGGIPGQGGEASGPELQQGIPSADMSQMAQGPMPEQGPMPQQPPMMAAGGGLIPGYHWGGEIPLHRHGTGEGQHLRDDDPGSDWMLQEEVFSKTPVMERLIKGHIGSESLLDRHMEGPGSTGSRDRLDSLIEIGYPLPGLKEPGRLRRISDDEAGSELLNIISRISGDQEQGTEEAVEPWYEEGSYPDIVDSPWPDRSLPGALSEYREAEQESFKSPSRFSGINKLDPTYDELSGVSAWEQERQERTGPSFEGRGRSGSSRELARIQAALHPSWMEEYVPSDEIGYKPPPPAGGGGTGEALLASLRETGIEEDIRSSIDKMGGLETDREALNKLLRGGAQSELDRAIAEAEFTGQHTDYLRSTIPGSKESSLADSAAWAAGIANIFSGPERDIAKRTSSFLSGRKADVRASIDREKQTLGQIFDLENLSRAQVNRMRSAVDNVGITIERERIERGEERALEALKAHVDLQLVLLNEAGLDRRLSIEMAALTQRSIDENIAVIRAAEVSGGMTPEEIIEAKQDNLEQGMRLFVAYMGVESTMAEGMTPVQLEEFKTARRMQVMSMLPLLNEVSVRRLIESGVVTDEQIQRFFDIARSQAKHIISEEGDLRGISLQPSSPLAGGTSPQP